MNMYGCVYIAGYRRAIAARQKKRVSLSVVLSAYGRSYGHAWSATEIVERICTENVQFFFIFMGGYF